MDIIAVELDQIDGDLKLIIYILGHGVDVWL